MKTRELDHLAKLAKAKQELMAKGKEAIPIPKDEIDLGQGTSSATVTKPSPNQSKKKATKKSNQVPPSPQQNLKDKQPIPEVLKRPTPRLAPKQNKIKQASQQTATNKRGTISHFSPICYKCHIRGHIGSQCANMQWQRVTNVSPSTKKLVVNSLWIDKTKIEGLKRNGPLWVKKSENGYVVAMEAKRRPNRLRMPTAGQVRGIIPAQQSRGVLLEPCARRVRGKKPAPQSRDTHHAP
ncbi:hypothetical protein LWI29_037232 [Acer saccharum]|uniref:CCHC-type domain-containing protein n=1 Tax=Acer saccharum TaxID=4024 RepID=A0AA39RF30_ACESA|nr:hypothetical protein LWI29_037232 [Acer saccharum]